MHTRLYYTDEKTDNRFFHYCLGFQPSDGILLIQEDKESVAITVLLDARYAARTPLISAQERAARFSKPTALEIKKRDKPLVDLLKDYISISDAPILLEKSLPFWVYEQLQHLDSFVWQRADDQYSTTLRSKKTPTEQHAMHKAIAKTMHLREWIEEQLPSFIGMTERAVRGKLIDQAFALGLEDEAFPTIVAFGENSAIPHHETSETRISNGPLLVDMGRRSSGYCSDMTRCFWVGAKTALYDKRKETLDIVVQAHAVGKERACVGASCRVVEEDVRALLEKVGLAQYFTHALGHGIGLDVHESPAISSRSNDIIEPGMCFTIEPGVYIPGQFGIRWEDTIVVANDVAIPKK